MNKFTKEDYENAAKASFSIAGMCRYLKIAPRGGNYATVKNYVKKYEIDTSHFTGQGWNTGLKFNPHPPFKMEEILVENRPYNTNTLKKRLIKEGYKDHKCENCGRSEWEGNPIPLELHHINGDRNDNRIENLEILCPNCHTMTDNFRGSNKKRYDYKNNNEVTNVAPKVPQNKQPKTKLVIKKEKVKKYCEYCGKELKNKRNKYCSQECAHNAVSKRPPVKEFIDKINEYNGNKCAIGRYYGVSDKAIAKWIQLYRL